MGQGAVTALLPEGVWEVGEAHPNKQSRLEALAYPGATCPGNMQGPREGQANRGADSEGTPGVRSCQEGLGEAKPPGEAKSPVISPLGESVSRA